MPGCARPSADGKRSRSGDRIKSLSGKFFNRSDGRKFAPEHEARGRLGKAEIEVLPLLPTCMAVEAIEPTVAHLNDPPPGRVAVWIPSGERNAFGISQEASLTAGFSSVGGVAPRGLRDAGVPLFSNGALTMLPSAASHFSYNFV